MGKSLNKILKATVISLAVAMPSVNYAAYIPLSATFESPTYTQELDVQKMARIGLELQKYYVFNTGRYIPAYEMPAYSSDEAHIANKIIKQTLETWIEDDYIDLDFIKNVKKIDDSLSAELPISKTVTAKDAGTFKIRIRPVSTEAQIRYEGKFGANLSYNIAENTTKFQISWSF